MRTIRVFCNMGMSTSVLVRNMKQSAEKQGYEVDITAFSVAEVKEKGAEADIILLGPQVGFQLKKIREQLPQKEVHVIKSADYGMMNGDAVIRFVRETLGD